MKKALKSIGREIGLFLSSKIFLLNFAGAIALVAVLIFLTSIILKSYTRHGESITLPKFTGQTMDKVADLMEDQNLRYHIIDSLYDPDKKPMEVLDQDPTPKSKVKENRIVYLTVNATSPPDVNLPNIWGKDLDFVKKLLKTIGISVDEKIRYKTDPAVNTVLEVSYEGEKLQQPRGKEIAIKLPKGSTLSLVVAEGMGSDVGVPKLVCQTLSEASFTINNYDLNLGSVINEEGLEDEQNAYIVRQRPSPGAVLNMGEQIDVWISRSQPESCSEDWGDSNEPASEGERADDGGEIEEDQ